MWLNEVEITAQISNWYRQQPIQLTYTHTQTHTQMDFHLTPSTHLGNISGYCPTTLLWPFISHVAVVFEATSSDCLPRSQAPRIPTDRFLFQNLRGSVWSPPAWTPAVCILLWVGASGCWTAATSVNRQAQPMSLLLGALMGLFMCCPRAQKILTFSQNMCVSYFHLRVGALDLECAAATSL